MRETTTVFKQSGIEGGMTSISFQGWRSGRWSLLGLETGKANFEKEANLDFRY